MSNSPSETCGFGKLVVEVYRVIVTRNLGKLANEGVGDLACTDVCTYDYSDCSLPPGGAKPSEYTGDGCAVVTPGAQRGSGLAGFAGLAGLALALFSAAKRARR